MNRISSFISRATSAALPALRSTAQAAKHRMEGKQWMGSDPSGNQYFVQTGQGQWQWQLAKGGAMGGE
jgi:hypothetical protein